MGIKWLNVCYAKACLAKNICKLLAAETILEKGERGTPRVVQVDLVLEAARWPQVWHCNYERPARLEYSIRLQQKRFWPLNSMLNHANRQVGIVEIVRAIDGQR